MAEAKEAPSHVRQNSVNTSGMSNAQVASKLFQYILDHETQKFELLLETVATATDNDGKPQWDIDFLFNKWTNDKGSSMFIVASYFNNIEAVRLLLKYKVNVNIARESDGTNALWYACFNNNTPIVRILMDNGADPNVFNKVNGETTIFHAAKNGNKKIIEKLLSDDATIPFKFSELINKYSRDEEYMSTFDICCRNGHLSCAKLLWELNVSKYNSTMDILREDYHNLCGLYRAFHYNRTELIKYLLHNVYPTHIKHGRINVAKMDPMTNNGHWGNTEIIKLVVEEYDVPINYPNEWDGQAALHLVTKNNYADCTRYICNHPKVDINILDKEGKTPLMNAVEMGNNQIVQVMLDSDANEKLKILEIKDKDNHTALDYCAIFGHVSLFKSLMSELFDRNNVENWQTLTASKLLDLQNIDSWIKLATENQCEGFLGFMNKIRKIVTSTNDNKYPLLYSIVDDTGDDDLAKKKLKESLVDYKKDYKIAKYLFNNLQKDTLNDLCNVINNAIVKQECAMNDTLLFISMQHNKNELMKSLMQCTDICLSSETKNVHNYTYFKTNLLDSNIWVIKTENENEDESESKTKDDNNNNNENAPESDDVKTSDTNDNTNNDDNTSEFLLFDKVKRTVIDDELTKQQKFIKEKIVEQEQKFEDDWFELRNAVQKYCCGQDEILTQNRLVDRYDNFIDIMKDKCLSSDYTLKELPFDNVNGFDGKSQYDNHGYLIKLLIHSYQLDPLFQEQCEKMFNKQTLGVKCEYHSAPPKTKGRCMMKASLEYNHRKWPHTSSILDFIRCGITFETSHDLIEGVLNFKNLVETGQAGCIEKIVRIKNGFADILDESWNIELNKFGYCDIKANVIVIKKKNDKIIKMIAEIQFLLRFMSNAKQMGHSIYGFVRKQDFYNGLANLLYKEDETEKIDEIENIIFSQNMIGLFTLLEDGNPFEKKLIMSKKDSIVSLMKASRWKKGEKLLQMVTNTWAKSMSNDAF